MAEGAVPTDAACLHLAKSVPPDQRGELLQALDQGVAERYGGPQVFADTGAFKEFARASASNSRSARTTAPLTPELKSWIESVWRDSDSDPLRLRLAARAGVRSAYERALFMAADQRSIEALGVLAEIGREDCVPKVLPLLRETEPEKVRSSALDVLVRFESPEITAAVLSNYASMSPSLRGKARETLLARASSAHTLLEQVDRGQFPAKEIPVSQLRRIDGFEDAKLNALVRKHWGAIGQGTDEAKLAEVRRLSNDLRAGTGDLNSGQKLFLRHCGACHKLFGAGGDLGMDLTPANRKDRMYLLTHIVDPSVLIRNVVSTISASVKPPA
jgi:mono/diheme cytochrome c family protein